MVPQRAVRRQRLLRPTDDPGFARSLETLLTTRRDTAVPTAEQLDQDARVTPADIASAVRLWNLSQRRAGTGLEGAL